MEYDRKSHVKQDEETAASDASSYSEEDSQRRRNKKKERKKDKADCRKRWETNARDQAKLRKDEEDVILEQPPSTKKRLVLVVGTGKGKGVTKGRLGEMKDILLR